MFSLRLSFRLFLLLNVSIEVCRNFVPFARRRLLHQALVRERAQNEVSRKRITAHQCWMHKMEFYFVSLHPTALHPTANPVRANERTTKMCCNVSGRCKFANIPTKHQTNVSAEENLNGFCTLFVSWFVQIVSCTYIVWSNVQAMHGHRVHTTSVRFKCHLVYFRHSEEILSTLNHQTLDYMHSRQC